MVYAEADGMEYHDSERATELATRAREFMDEVVIPAEREQLGQGPPDESLVEELRQEARAREIYCPQIGEEWGGMGEDFRDVLPLFEQAGRSLLGATAMRVDAPDEGNMHTLELVGSDRQKEQWLKPLVAGEIRSGFSMTEPQDGAGSDPKMLKTTAEKDGDEWVVDGHKWWTTQGSHADVFIVMAVTDPDAHPYEGASMILVPRDADGVTIERDIPHLGPDMDGHGHAEITYDNVRVPQENLLGAENAGFAIAQQRLGPARLTHCMRFSGMAERSLEIAKAYIDDREAFGSKLSEKQSLRYRIAEAETELHAARCMVRHAAQEISQGEQARVPVSMSKVFTANVCQDAIDLALQACGGTGISRDVPIADFYEAVRAFRIVDGADEVHNRVIARNAFSDLDYSELENVTRF
jgi:acyl-CoA dehydrogenase